MLNFLGVLFSASIVLFNFAQETTAQMKSNFEIAEELTQQSVNELQVEIDVEELMFKSNLTGEFKILENGFMNSVKSRFPSSNFANDNFHFSYSIKSIETKYENSFQKNLFGDLHCERKIILNGSWFGNDSKTPLKNFSFTSVDTISVLEIENVENGSIYFTRGEIPDTPIWSSIYEPIIIIGSAAAAVYLFFTVRSK